MEAAVTGRLAVALADRMILIADLGSMLTPASLAGLEGRAAEAAGLLQQRQCELLRRLVRQVRLTPTSIEINCAAAELAAVLGMQQQPGAPARVTFAPAVRPIRSGRAMRLVQGRPRNGSDASVAPGRSSWFAVVGDKILKLSSWRGLVGLERCRIGAAEDHL